MISLANEEQENLASEILFISVGGVNQWIITIRHLNTDVGSGTSALLTPKKSLK